MKSPFKFLDAYTLADSKVFFGRKEEVEALYKLVFRTDLLLVYGLSGTGKTSLIRCGLASRFDGPDWYPLFITRGADINAALRAELGKALKAPPTGSLAEAVSALFDRALRPIYLIFDQFEELFILGTPEEQQQLIQDLQALLAAGLPCKVLLVMREEYIGHLYHFEKAIPEIFDFRVRVEPMTNAKVMEVMQRSFLAFNIELEPPAEERCRQMIDNISGEKAGIQLPYLQVYLDMLYREDYRRTYGDQIFEGDWPPLEFTEQEISDFGKIEAVLKKFLRERTQELQAEIQSLDPALPADAVQKILDAFVTDQGTKRPMAYARQDNLLILRPPAGLTLPPISGTAMNACLLGLERARLLRIASSQVELAHDSLAALIDGERTDEQRQLNEVKMRLGAGYLEWQRAGVFLTPKQLIGFEPYLEKLRLEPHLQQFVQDSYAHNETLEQEKQRRQQAELEKERSLRAEAETARKEAEENAKLATDNAEQARKRTNIAVMLAVLATMVLVFALQKCQQAKSASAKLKEASDTLKIAKDFSQQKVIELDSSYKKLSLTNSDLEKSQANLQKAQDSTKATLAKLETYTAEAMPVLINNIKDLILHLKYEEALTQCKTAWNLNARRPEVARLFQEIAFFFTESGAHSKALEALKYIRREPGRLSGTLEQRRQELLNALKKIDGQYFRETLETRYYPAMVKVAGGSYTIGCDERWPGVDSCDNAPLMTVSDFYIARTETTVWQYYLYIRSDTSRSMPQPPSWQWLGDHPMVYVSWWDALSYADWLSRQLGKKPVFGLDFPSDPNDLDGQINIDSIADLNWSTADGFRPPTEAEWEYAARGGRDSKGYEFAGYSVLDSVGWYNKNNDPYGAKAVGQKWPNELGLYDLSGNVWEWCWDRYGDYPGGPQNDYRGDPNRSARVLRGGSWDYFVSYCRVSIRNYYVPRIRSYYGFGFRVAQDY